MIGILHRTQTLRLRDDRGVPRPIRSPHLRLEWKADEGAVTWYRLAQVRRDSESVVTRLVGWGVLAAACVLLLYAGVGALRSGDSGKALLMFAFVPPVIGLGLIWRSQMRAALHRLEARRAALPPVCPSCRYDLAGLSPEGDGCVVCPECGAAWKVGNALASPEIPR